MGCPDTAVLSVAFMEDCTVDLHGNVNVTIVTDAARWEIPNERWGLKIKIAKYNWDDQLLSQMIEWSLFFLLLAYMSYYIFYYVLPMETLMK